MDEWIMSAIFILFFWEVTYLVAICHAVTGMSTLE